MIFKTDNSAAAAFSAAFIHKIADHSVLCADGIVIYSADEIAHLTVPCLVVAAQHLISAADSEECLAVCNRRLNLICLAACKIPKQYLLLKVLSAADKEYIKISEFSAFTYGYFCDTALYIAPLKTLFHTYYIALISVKIENVGIQVAYFKFHLISLFPVVFKTVSFAYFFS